MSQRRIPWIFAMLAAAPLTVDADTVDVTTPAADYCRRAEVKAVGRSKTLVVYDDQGKILDENAKPPDSSELVAARVVACGESEDGILLYQVQLNGLRKIWVRSSTVIFKPTAPVYCEPSTEHPGTQTTSRNADCTK